MPPKLGQAHVWSTDADGRGERNSIANLWLRAVAECTVCVGRLNNRLGVRERIRMT